MNKEIVVREAVLEDLFTLLAFEQGVITAERPFDPTLAKDPITYYNLEEMILSDKAVVLVAVADKRIIASGFGKLKQAKPYLDHEIYAYLGFMFTHADYRGQGVNQHIVNELMKWSDSKGIKEVRLTVYTENIGAIKAYEKIGFKQYMIEMRLK
ncbi:Acetyltransferase [hydrothermal vent metagenome]|uniref:Acetyltransferase n=1 Tax=hydrothermal vent metagenome TaxID=652676 RepID=A0A3B0T2B8_9ZZZZ